MYCIQSYSYRVYIYWHQGVAKLVSQQLVEFWVDMLFLQGLKEFFSLIFVKFTSCSLWLLKFRSVGIFAISLLLTEIWLFLNFQFFLTVTVICWKTLSIFLKSEFSFCPPELRSVGIFKIFLTVYQLEMFKFWNFWQCASQCIKNFYIKKFFCT